MFVNKKCDQLVESYAVYRSVAFHVEPGINCLFAISLSFIVLAFIMCHVRFHYKKGNKHCNTCSMTFSYQHLLLASLLIGSEHSV